MFSLGPTRADACPQEGMRLVFFHTRGLCSPLILLFRTEPKQWGRWAVSCSRGSEVCLSFGSGSATVVRLKLNLQGLSMQGFFFLSLLRKSYKQNIEHCYAHSRCVSSCHSQCIIFMSVPLFVLLGFVC